MPTSVNGTVTGGDGDDSFYFGAAFDAQDVADGGGGSDQVLIQGNYDLAIVGSMLVSIEKIALLSGDVATYGDPGTNFYDYVLATSDDVLTTGQSLVIDGSSLRPGEDFRFDGSAESSGSFRIFAGRGQDRLIGGNGDDEFVFLENRFGTGDQVTGNGGNDTLVLRGAAGLNLFGFQGAETTGIEKVRLISGSDATFGSAGGNVSYILQLANGNVASGTALVVDGSGLGADETVSVDGSLESDGALDLTGGGGADDLRGGLGNDSLDGGLGGDELTGGGGDDAYVVDDALDSVSELSGEGTDSVETALSSYTIPDNVENLAYTGNAAATLSGNSGNNLITGGANGDMFLLQQGGNDNVTGGGGDDIFFFGALLNSLDVANGGAGTADRLLVQGNQSLTLSGTMLVGIEALLLVSGTVTAFGDPGTNRYDYSFATLDNLLAGRQTLTVNGNSLQPGEDFSFNGSAESTGSFLLYAGSGVDFLVGGKGNDQFVFGEARFATGDKVVGNGGSDTLVLRGNYHISFQGSEITGIERLRLISGTDAAFGTPAQSFTYNLQLADGNVAAGATLAVDGSGLKTGETLSVDGSLEANGNLVLLGGASADQLLAGSGNDRLDGGAGADQMTGGLGNDTYVIDAAQDVITEAANAGIDTVESAFTYTLGVEFENLTLTGTGPIDGTGNGAANLLQGNSGANLLDGKAGADTLVGGGGNDTYVLDNPADKIVETTTSSSSAADVAKTSVSYVLAAGVRVENLETTNAAGTGAISLTGNEFRQTITGNDGGNTLSGKAGSDTIKGGAGSDKIFGGTGNDILFGGSGQDGFYFDAAPNASTNRDTIDDFDPVYDSILLNQSIFAIGTVGTPSATAPSAIQSDAFKRIDGYDPAAPFARAIDPDAGDRIIYDQAAGKIYYDADGSGATKAIVFATVDAGTALSAADFLVFI